jgi:hypothetical protein
MDDLLISVMAGALIAVIIVLTGSTMYNIGYKNGQIDAMNGKIKYEKQIKEVEQWIQKENR